MPNKPDKWTQAQLDTFKGKPPLALNRIGQAFRERQEPLGEEFEAAIFGDLDSLYES